MTTMNYSFFIGILGSLILITGAAWKEKKVKPIKSVKNWLFAIGGLSMFAYSILNYQHGGSIFFVFLQVLVNISSVLMMINLRDKYDFSIISGFGLGLTVWSLYLFEGYNTILFILGLCILALGYCFEMATLRRNLALTLGAILIAVFSYIEASWVFFWLNVFFAIFSGYYSVKFLKV